MHACACFLLEEIARTPNSGLLSIPEIWWISAGTGHIAKTDVGSLSQTPAQSFRRLSLEDSWAILSMVISGKRLPWEFCSWTIEDLPHSCKASCLVPRAVGTHVVPEYPCHNPAFRFFSLSTCTFKPYFSLCTCYSYVQSM